MVFRGFYFLDRTADLFREIWLSQPIRFKEHFRMSKDTFSTIFREVEPYLLKDNIVGDTIPPIKRFAIMLERLNRTSYYKTISDLYGIGETTAANITNEVSRVIVNKLWSSHVAAYLPCTREQMEVTQQYMEFPYAFAAIDGCHIPIKCPPGGSNSL